MAWLDALHDVAWVTVTGFYALPVQCRARQVYKLQQTDNPFCDISALRQIAVFPFGA